jgi:aryl-alcohol dehydrogenase-like predicted oxidoreductase
MKYRTLGRTGIQVSEIGYGAWGIGQALWVGATDPESMRALNAAVDEGVNFIDTALVYGNGHSEQLVGRLLKERKEKIAVASKIPPKNGIWPARPGSSIEEVFPAPYIIECTEASLRNLGRDTIDLQQFHVWQDDWCDSDEWKTAIEKLKKAGKIRHAGISINDHQPANALRTAATGLIDAFQVIYNIYDQAPARELFPYCAAHNIGIIVRVPLDEGALTGTITEATVFADGDFRKGYFRGDRKKEVVERANALKLLLGTEAATLPELALRYCLHPAAVSTVIPGMRSVTNVKANCAVSDGKRLSNAVLAELKMHAWEKNFYKG